MQLIIIILCVAVFCLWMRGDDEDHKKYVLKKNSAQDREQIERLKDRVSTLENIILDRDRGLRGGFDKL